MISYTIIYYNICSPVRPQLAQEREVLQARVVRAPAQLPIYIYIYIYICLSLSLSIYIHIQIYIYIYIYTYRQIDRYRDSAHGLVAGKWGQH